MRWAGLLLAALAGCASAPPPLPAAPGETAEELYRRAERSFVAGDFEATVTRCEHALQLDPRYVPAIALLQEATFIQWSDRAAQQALAQSRLAKFEDWLELGRQHLFHGSLAQAELCVQLALDLLSLLPPEMDVELRVAQVQALSDWVKVFREDGEQ